MARHGVEQSDFSAVADGNPIPMFPKTVMAADGNLLECILAIFGW
jgi:hypothetical protein